MTRLAMFAVALSLIAAPAFAAATGQQATPFKPSAQNSAAAAAIATPQLAREEAAPQTEEATEQAAEAAEQGGQAAGQAQQQAQEGAVTITDKAQEAVATAQQKARAAKPTAPATQPQE
ncbi:MAG: hypothetical protein GC131_02120 [Alphaproteobacteria bacterium]|nr:hypothetical protein [Alphaproteobacteria bacterium]